MNKNTLLGVGVAIVVIIFGAWAYSEINNNIKPLPDVTGATSTVAVSTTSVEFVPPQPQRPQTRPVVTTQPAVKYVPLPAVLSQPGAHKCVYSQVQGNTQSSGVVYLADGKMRSEFRTVGNNGNLAVFDGRYLYVWKEGTNSGVRTLYTDISQLSAIIPNDLTSGVILGSSTNNAAWKCTPWIKDASLLSVPKGVSF